jgi:hypothetical protein
MLLTIFHRRLLVESEIRQLDIHEAKNDATVRYLLTPILYGCQLEFFSFSRLIICLKIWYSGTKIEL